ncbi:hypothetical protein [Rugosimonospora africana]|uniref:Uncharacterized protein n=1 Tax=Rugosimonospora africana TaxID=556532 RepID=A0A8J3VU06_9ACTN|nr:hypothetical protein [Rugosimonospora africana]GIH18972.1 hypothetical protein Raf01_71440 [Rugosimonospora africana]
MTITNLVSHLLAEDQPSTDWAYDHRVAQGRWVPTMWVRRYGARSTQSRCGSAFHPLPLQAVPLRSVTDELSVPPHQRAHTRQVTGRAIVMRPILTQHQKPWSVIHRQYSHPQCQNHPNRSLPPAGNPQAQPHSGAIDTNPVVQIDDEVPATASEVDVS